jgi:hypothetical protein
MSASRAGVRVETTRYAILVAAATATVAVLGAIATGRISFAVATVVSAALAFGTIAAASRKGRDALAAGEPVRAGAVAGILLSARLVGLAGLMVAATAAPVVLDIWGVVAGVVVADAALLASGGFKALTVA